MPTNPTLAHTKTYEKKSNSDPATCPPPSPKKVFFEQILSLRKKRLYFYIPMVFLITFPEGNGCAKVEENKSNDTLVYDDDAHKVVLWTHSPFF